ncbi:MAG: pantetheine-phosphate adenylyltransferase [Candidatus Diapherotrites archaeon]|nr:pantetheine-phosphate adenylyltransferase [Candidatus Diapherotrites archaeon]
MAEKRIAVYPGTFDPITFGHLDIIERALNLFDKVVVAVAQSDNYNKQPLFSLNERLSLVKKALDEKGLKNVDVNPFSDLLVDFVNSQKSKVIVRGLRAVSDFDYEFQYATTNRVLAPKIETVCIMTSRKFLFLSSKIVKEISSFKGNCSEFVPKCVEKALKEKFK